MRLFASDVNENVQKGANFKHLPLNYVMLLSGFFEQIKNTAVCELVYFTSILSKTRLLSSRMRTTCSLLYGDLCLGEGSP